MLQSRLIRRRHEPQRLIASDCNHKLKRLFSKRQFTYAIKKKTVTFVATQGVELQQVYLCELQAAGLEASPPIMLELLFVCNSTLPAFPIWDQSNRERESSKGMGLGVAVNSTQPRTGASRAILGLMGKGKGGIFHGPNKKSLNTRIGAATAICVDFGTLCETHEHEQKRSRNPSCMRVLGDLRTPC